MEMNELMKIYEPNLNATQAELDEFLGREQHRRFTSMSKSRQATAQTAKTLAIAPDGPEKDSVQVADFCTFVVQSLCEALLISMQLSPTLANVQKVTQSLQGVETVSDEMLQQGLDVARAKSLFRLVDADGHGGISRNELYSILKQMKTPVTKRDAKAIFRKPRPQYDSFCD
jgi:hypothetical protein